MRATGYIEALVCGWLWGGQVHAWQLAPSCATEADAGNPGQEAKVEGRGILSEIKWNFPSWRESDLTSGFLYQCLAHHQSLTPPHTVGHPWRGGYVVALAGSVQGRGGCYICLCLGVLRYPWLWGGLKWIDIMGTPSCSGVGLGQDITRNLECSWLWGGPQ